MVASSSVERLLCTASSMSVLRPMCTDSPHGLLLVSVKGYYVLISLFTRLPSASPVRFTSYKPSRFPVFHPRALRFRFPFPTHVAVRLNASLSAASAGGGSHCRPHAIRTSIIHPRPGRSHENGLFPRVTGRATARDMAWHGIRVGDGV